MKIPGLSPLARTYLLVGAAVACLAALLWGKAGLAGTGAGLVIGAGNLWAVRQLAGRAVAAAESGTAGAAWTLVTGLMVKMAGLFLLAWVAVRVLHLGILPFALGFSALVLSLVLAGSNAFAPRETA